MTEIEILEQNAVDAAIAYQWDNAIKINKKILSSHKKNLPAMLRLAFAYMQNGDLTRAKKYYRQVLKIQPINTVAKENIERIKILQDKKIKKQSHSRIFYDPELFLETVGKTKSIKLVNLGQKNILAQLMVGQEVIMKVKRRRVEIRTKSNEYIGCLPDDLSKRLRLFIKAKSLYTAYIKENTLSNLIIFIREEKKGKKVTNFISFPVNLANNINKIGGEINKEEMPINDDNLEESSELDLEKIAESLTNEEKEILPYESGEENEEE